MTKEMEDKIYNQYPNPEGLSDILFETRKLNAAKRTGARYGYSLAETELAEKDKRIKELQKEIGDFDFKLDMAEREIERLKGLIEKLLTDNYTIEQKDGFKTENNLL